MGKMTPDMTGKARDISDNDQLYARLGYRVYREWLRTGHPSAVLRFRAATTAAT